MNFLVRWQYRLMNIWHSGDDLNRRVKAEQYLFDCASGKKPLPDAAKCRELALFLGTPSWAKRKLWRTSKFSGRTLERSVGRKEEE